MIYARQWLISSITVTSWWVWWHLKSPVLQLFTKMFIQVQIKENVKAPHHWPLCGEFTSDWWIPCNKGPVTQKMFPFDDVIMTFRSLLDNPLLFPTIVFCITQHKLFQQFTNILIVCSTACSGADQRKHQSSASLAFVRGIHWWPVNSPHKGPVMQKMFSFNDVILLQHPGNMIDRKDISVINPLIGRKFISVNPLCAELIWENIHKYFHLLSSRNAEMVQVVEIHHHERQEPDNHTQSTPWLMMTRWHKNPSISSHGIYHVTPKYADSSTKWH